MPILDVFTPGQTTFAYFDEACLTPPRTRNLESPTLTYAGAYDFNRRKTPVLITGSTVLQVDGEALNVLPAVGENQQRANYELWTSYRVDQELQVRFMDRFSSPLYNLFAQGQSHIYTALRVNGVFFIVLDVSERNNINQVDVTLRRIPFNISSRFSDARLFYSQLARGLDRESNNVLEPPTPAKTQNFAEDKQVSVIRIGPTNEVERIEGVLK